MQIEQEIQKRIVTIEAVLSKYLPKEEGYQKTVFEAMNYSIASGGKRLRPMLMLESYRLFGGKSKVIEPFMAAIEMLHTYSLVHDDLPAMDNDEYRRGKKTTHIVYGEAIGILAGDGLLNYSFETALHAYDIEPESKNISKALRIFAEKAGIYGMIGGQTVDVEWSGKIPSPEQLHFIYSLKTCALIEAAMQIGAALAGATKNEQKKIGEIAREIGMAFQIRDDVLDVISTTEVLGKPIGSDLKNHKYTYVTMLGMDKAQEDIKIYTKKATDRLDSLVVKNEFLKALLLYLTEREK